MDKIDFTDRYDAELDFESKDIDDEVRILITKGEATIEFFVNNEMAKQIVGFLSEQFKL